MDASACDTDRVVLGRINGVFGTRGWIKIYSYTRPRDSIFDYPRWEIRFDGAWRTHDVVDCRRQGNGLIAALSGLTERDAAVAYLNHDIAVSRALLPPGAPGEFYWHDLVGLTVINREGSELGRVTRLLETGAHDVLVVGGDRERLIPYVAGIYVDAVELDAGRIVVDWHVDD